MSYANIILWLKTTSIRIELFLSFWPVIEKFCVSMNFYISISPRLYIFTGRSFVPHCIPFSVLYFSVCSMYCSVALYKYSLDLHIPLFSSRCSLENFRKQYCCFILWKCVSIDHTFQTDLLFFKLLWLYWCFARLDVHCTYQNAVCGLQFSFQHKDGL